MVTARGMEEQTPRAVPHDAVIDEVTLTRHTPASTCFGVVIRTAVDNDEPLDQLHPRCILGRERRAAVVSGEEISIFDYDLVRRQSVVEAHAVGPGGQFSLNLGRSVPSVFRVVERTGLVCCDGGDRHQVGLRLESVGYMTGTGNALQVVYNIR